MTVTIHTVFGALTTTVVGSAIVAGLVVTGTPDQRRSERLDQRRLQDLQTIQAEIQALVRDPDHPDELRRPLPQSLAEAAASARDRQLTLRDPVTNTPYGYRVLGESSYRLSASFALPREADHEVFWNHPPGHHGFVIDVFDPP